MIARPAASDHRTEMRIQTAKPTSPAALTSPHALTPANGRDAAVRYTASATASPAAVKPVMPAKKPPARKQRNNVSAAGASRCSRHPPTRARPPTSAAGSSCDTGAAAGMAGKDDGRPVDLRADQGA